MTIASRLTLSIFATFVALAWLTATAWWGLNGLSRDLDVALKQYERLHDIHDVGIQVRGALTMLESFAEPSEVSYELQRTGAKLSQLLEPGPETEKMLADLAKLEGEVARMRSDDMPLIRARLNRVIWQIADLATRTNRIITETAASARQKREQSIRTVIILAGILFVGTVIVSLWVYNSVMGPLHRLRRGVKTIASGSFSDRLDTSRGGEFGEVAAEFNHMAGQLDELYRDLERKVREKSSELVRSERLASVGFLAAGVAHEINNPLNIMSGYAELCLRKLEKDAPTAKEEAAKALTIITEETFRCKRIIEKLLSLTRGGDDTQGPVSIAEVARDVADLVDGLPRYRDRTLSLDLPPGDDGELTVQGNETELKQVLLNLTVNALEAASPKTGRVVVGARRRNDHVELTVKDNGKGMTPHTLSHVFEPFYTEKRGAAGSDEEPGTGLGLAITHAIVEQHGGRISAASAGLGKGSTFTVELPIGSDEQ